MLRNRDTKEKKNKAADPITFRPKVEDRTELEERAKRAGKRLGTYVTYSVARMLRKGQPETGYECDSCRKRITVGEPYYCETANKERLIESSESKETIDISDSCILKTLCEHCARKRGKLKQFDEPSEVGDFVGESERELEA